MHADFYIRVEAPAEIPTFQLEVDANACAGEAAGNQPQQCACPSAHLAVLTAGTWPGRQPRGAASHAQSELLEAARLPRPIC